MNRSPTLAAFRLILSRPVFGLAEIGWRWSFGAAAWLLTAHLFGEYFQSLAVTPSDMVLLRTRQPALIAQAVLHIFHGSGGRLVTGGLILFLTMATAWIVVAALGRAAILETLRDHFSPVERQEAGTHGVAGLLGLNFLRTTVLLATLSGSVGAIWIGGLAGSKDPLAIRTAAQFSMAVLLLVWGAGSLLNWFFSLASVFTGPVFRAQTGSSKPGVVSAILAAADFCQDHFVGVLAINTWFGFARLAAITIAGTLLLIPVSMAALVPGWVVWMTVLSIALFYFAMADFLCVGRLAAYVCLVESPGIIAVPPRPTRVVAASVDQDELILSDLGLQPEPGAV